MQTRLSDLNNLVIVRGGGDLATGTIHKLCSCGFPVLILETDHPAAIRRNVAFSEAVYEGSKEVEGITAYRASSQQEARSFLKEGKLALLVDPEGESIEYFNPLVMVDAIIAKKNLGSRKDMAPITVALGPGFEAGKDVDAVIETKRGHKLGRIYYQGMAIANTGIPGNIAGYGKARVIHSPAKGMIRTICSITQTVAKGQEIARIETEESSVPVIATLDGILRGLIRDGYPVSKGFKIADIDPRQEEYENCFTISDKARCIAGGVLEAILHLKRERSL